MPTGILHTLALHTHVNPEEAILPANPVPSASASPSPSPPTSIPRPLVLCRMEVDELAWVLLRRNPNPASCSGVILTLPRAQVASLVRAVLTLDTTRACEVRVRVRVRVANSNCFEGY